MYADDPHNMTCFGTIHTHHAGRKLTSEWNINSLIKVVCENLFSPALDRKICLSFKKLYHRQPL